MRFEVRLPGGIDCWALRAAGLDVEGWTDASVAASSKRAALPVTFRCPYLLGDSSNEVCLTISSFGEAERIDRWKDAAGRIVIKRGARPESSTHVQVETGGAKAGRAVRKVLTHYSYDSDGEGVWWREHIAAWEEIESILRRDRLSYDALGVGGAVLTRRAIESLMELCRKTVPVRRDNIYGLFTDRNVAKSDRGFAAAWLIKQFEAEWKIQDQLGMRIWDLATPAVADDLIRLVVDQRYTHHRGPLVMALAKTKDSRAADVIAWVVGQDGLTRCALEALARLRGAAAHVEKIQGCLRHADPEVRREAKKTLKKLGFPIELPPSPVHLVAGRRAIPKGLKEWSQNLDMGELAPTLERLSKCVDRGFGPADVAEVIAVVEDMKPDQTRSFRFPVVAGGKKTDLWLVVFMDDIDAPDLRIHAVPQIVKKLHALTPALD